MSAEYELPDPDEAAAIADMIIESEMIRCINENAAERDTIEFITGLERKFGRAEKRQELRKRFGAWITENLIEVGNSMPGMLGLKTAYKMIPHPEQPGDVEPGAVQ